MNGCGMCIDSHERVLQQHGVKAETIQAAARIGAVVKAVATVHATLVTLTSDGSLTSCEVTKSSGYASLDSETCELISTYGHFQPVRNADGRGVAAIHEGIVNWTLPPNAPETAKVRMASSTTGRDPDKIICRRDVATGSLVSTVKRCMTRREWGRASDQAQEEVARVQGKGMAWDGD
jgi:hypothetical protein